MLVNVPADGQKFNNDPSAPALFMSPGWQTRRVPLHVTHDFALAQAMARDGYPMAYIPPTRAGVESLLAELRNEPRRERDDDREVWWLIPKCGSAAADAAVEACRLFAQENLDATGPFYSTHEAYAPTLEAYERSKLEYYERNNTSLPADDLACWVAEIEEGRREEEEEKEQRAREKARRLEREDAEAVFRATPDWTRRTIPLHVCHDPAVMESLARDGIPVAIISPTAAGAGRLADALRAEPRRDRWKDRQLVWLLPAVTAIDANYDEEAFAAQTQARSAASDALVEFEYLKRCSSQSDTPLDTRSESMTSLRFPMAGWGSTSPRGRTSCGTRRGRNGCGSGYRS